MVSTVRGYTVIGRGRETNI